MCSAERRRGKGGAEKRRRNLKLLCRRCLSLSGASFLTWGTDDV